jgi:formylglycine-generating enzyme required for sulfatase activity
MSGNVREWCWDRYSSTYYADLKKKATLTENPKGPDSGGSRTSRGGGWYYGEKYIRVIDRSIDAPTVKYHYLGMRVVRTAK